MKMSEKRFSETERGCYCTTLVFDNQTQKKLGTDKAVILLNELAEENEMLKQSNKLENALITNADLLFDGSGGRNGRNFILTLTLETIYGGVTVSFNPMRLPQLLEQLGLKQFSELKGTYVQIPKTRIGEQVKGIKSIMAKNNEKWFKTENHIYFGSEFFKGYGDSV